MQSLQVVRDTTLCM